MNFNFSVKQGEVINPIFVVCQDGTERMVDSLSLIDAVMPDVVASRQQANQAKSNMVKNESNNTNGDDGSHSYSKFYCYISYIVHL